jgi:WD40 repeat protein
LAHLLLLEAPMLRSAVRKHPFGVAVLLFCAVLAGQSLLLRSPSVEPEPTSAGAVAAPARTGGLERRITEGVLALALSPDGERVASVDADGSLRVWDLASRAELRSLAAHPAAATGIAFSQDGKLLLSVGRDSVVRVWRADDLASVAELEGHEHPIRAIAASEAAGLVATAGDETRVMLWDVRDQALRAVLGGLRDFVNGLAMSADGALLAAAGADGRILVWDLRADAPRLLHTLRGHAGPVNAVAFAGGAALLASASDDGTVKLWDLELGRQVRSLAGDGGPVRSIAIDPDRRWLASTADHDTRVFDLDSGAVVRVLGSDGPLVNSLLITPAGRIVAGDAQRGIVEWDVLTGARVDLLAPVRPIETSRAAPAAAAPPRAAAPVRLLESFLSWLVPAASAAPLPTPDDGPGGPILVVTSGTSPFETFYPEILRNEGFNAFAVRSIGSLSAATLAGYDVVILAEVDVSGPQATLLSDWVNAGGNLIAMRPDPDLAGLLGIASTGEVLHEAYLRVDAAAGPGYGIAPQSMQYHGTADRYTLAGASALATLYDDAATPSANPAVTLRQVGASGGHAAAFVFDLARSIVYTRQGNPDWVGEDRDALAPRRSNDLFFGNSPADPQPDWVDLDNVEVPQADEQQRFLANLIGFMTGDQMPLPRFWYFPRGERVVLIMTGDDHAHAGTIARFDQFNLDSAPGCSVEDWECIRGTSYVYPGTPIPLAQALAFDAQGFEIGIHISTSCANYTPVSLANDYTTQLAEFGIRFPGVTPPITQRHHCIAWSDWTTGAEVQLANGMRLDTTYYYWPPGWVDNRPGYFTGSAMPMRFSALDGELIDVYQAATQLTDESGQFYPGTVDTLFDWALGPEERYGAIVINAHTDFHPIPESDTSVASAIARDVPVITSRQMLEWLDGRNSSTLESLAWSGGVLSFDVTADAAARGLQTLVPWVSTAGVVVDVLRDGSPVPFAFSAVKGVGYARIDSGTGSYSVVYGADTAAPTVAPVTPGDGETFVNPGTEIIAGFSEGMDAASFADAEIELLAAGTPVAAIAAYRSVDQTLLVQPVAALQTGTTYTVTVRGGAAGPTDLAGNPLAADTAWSFTTMPSPGCPCSVWTPADAPVVPADSDPSSIEVGMRFRADLPGFVTGVRFYKGPGNTGVHVGNLWSGDGTRLATATFSNETASGWQQVDFANPVAIAANTEYVVSYFAPNGRYASDSQAFSIAGIDTYPLHVPASGANANGVYSYGSTSVFPEDSFQASNYWVDVVFDTTAPPDVTPPSISARSPPDGAIDVGLAETLTATFSEPMSAATINASSVRLRDAGGAIVPTTLGWDAFTNTVTLVPIAALDPLSLHTFVIEGGAGGVADLAGNLLPADAITSFTTQAEPVCPCTGFDPAQSPVNPAEDDPESVELGVKFRTDQSGFISGVRFYKGAGNTGTHVGNLWTGGGVLLASAIFTGETETGWQEVSFATPVPVTAGALYVASYFAPNGSYASDVGYFSASGVDEPPVRLLRDGASGGNGVYTYSASSAFPLLSNNATNYWVDVVFSNDPGAPPAVTGTQPAGGIVNAPVTAVVSATFSEPMDPATISAATFSLRNATGALVPAGVSYDGVTRTATLAPTAALAFGAAYTATLVGGPAGVLDETGQPLAGDVSWTFTTMDDPACCSAFTPLQVPGVPAQNDGSSVELGVKFRSDVPGVVKGIRFYKGVGNTGTHIGSLWHLNVPTALATAVFTNETATGWQQVDFAQPVPILANRVYIASYFAPNGHYAADQFFFQNAGVDKPPLHLLKNGVRGGNGVYHYTLASAYPAQSYRSTNYWVDVVFSPDNGLAPAVIATQPPNGAVDVALDTAVTATFSEAMNPATISAATFSLRNPQGAVVPASVSYDPIARTALLVPTLDLASDATYTATLVSGAAGVRDAMGVPLAGDVTWSFTTLDVPDCCSVWTPQHAPGTSSKNDTAAVEVGVKFRSDVNGFITGIRFYKGTGNTGTHVGNLWTLTGTLLGSTTFTDETAFGWQQADFATPVPVTAGLTYVASYHAPNGRYAGDAFFFQNSGVDSPPLHLLQNGVSGGNGVYRYGATSAFPNNTFNATNYWVDVILATADSLPPQVVATVPAAGADNVATDVAVSATFSKSIDPASITPATFVLRDAGGAVVPALVGYDDASFTATLVPGGDLDYGATYSATLTGGPSGVRDPSGQYLASDFTWSFTTTPEPVCCSVWTNLDVPGEPSEPDSNPVELGVKFRSDVNGFIKGIRFYKGAGNTGTHVGNLWTSTGSLLASATFTNETSTGWQYVEFAEPAPIAANVVYVASYFAPNGRYAADSGYFASAGVSNPPLHLLQNGVSGANGVFAYTPSSAFPTSSWNATNYWVDPVFTTNNGLAPMVALTFPPDGSTSAPIGTAIQAIFSEAMNPASVSGSVFELRASDGSLVPAAVSYDGPALAAILTPSAPLEFGATYTARIFGGPSGPLDLEGVPLAGDVTWSFTTLSQPDCCSVWSPTDVPANPSENDANAVEVGVKFRADQPGFVTAVRFYKGAGNTGTHVGHLWASDGTLLASATFAGETPTGWQQVSFPTPVAVAANTTYVASYHAPNGNYAADGGYFTAAGVDVPPLHLLQNGVDGPNGVFSYGPAGTFPSSTFNATNYWVDVVFTAENPSDECLAPPNEIVAENCLVGNPPSEWDVIGIGDPTLQGYATEISVDRGETVDFKIDTTAADYRLDIYRIGYYGGLGARFIDTVTPSVALPQNQPACNDDPSTGLVDCGNWAVSASWSVPASATSGIYVARAVRTDTGGASHIVFVVRDDAGGSDLLFQTADTTWQAYNDFGGNNLYQGGPAGRAYKVSYNRPFHTRIVDDGQDWLFNAEYPMVRWLESNGYDVSYTTGVDIHRNSAPIQDHAVFLSVGHDEYWSAEQRANVEAARDAGVHLAFFSGNEVFWKTRFEDGERTLVCYKETHEGAVIDPMDPPIWTGTWRDPRFSPPGDAGRPENELTGQLFMVNDGATTNIRVPAEDGRMRFWRNTAISVLPPGTTATLANLTLGYEWDEDVDNGFRPAGQIRLSTTTVADAPVLQDFGSNYASGTAVHHLTLYRAASGALVFGAGTVQWTWGLDSNHDQPSGPADVRMQQATANLFADMGVQPATLRSPLLPATASSDSAFPTSTIGFPADGATLGVGNPVTITGTASDTGGGVVGGVEVSVDDGATWHPASGRESWSYTWTPTQAGPTTLRTRAADDSVNLEIPAAGIDVTVQ